MGAESLVHPQRVDQPDTERDFSHFSPRNKKSRMSGCSAHLHVCVCFFFFPSGKVSGSGSLPGVCGAAEQYVVVNVITPLGQSDNLPLRLSLNRRKVLWHIKRGSINMALTGGGAASACTLSWPQSAQKVSDIQFHMGKVSVWEKSRFGNTHLEGVKSQWGKETEHFGFKSMQ